MYFDEIDQVCNLGARGLTVVDIVDVGETYDCRGGNAGAGERCDALRAHEEIEQEAQTDKGENAREEETHAGLWCFESIHDVGVFLSQGTPQQNCGERWLGDTYI